MKTQQEYWEDQIIDWENGTYGFKRNKEVPVIERFAELFRATVKNRPGILYQILQKERPAKVIEFGCGSGTYIIRWVKEGIIKSAVAVDIPAKPLLMPKKLRLIRASRIRLPLLIAVLWILILKNIFPLILFMV